MKKLFYLLLALPLAFAACNETPEETPKPEPEPTEGVVFEAKSFTGNYDYEEGDEAGAYAIVLSDNGYTDEGGLRVNSTYYALIIYGAIAEGEVGSTIVLPAGEYTLDKSGAVGTISPYASFLCKTHDDPDSNDDDEVAIFKELTLVVTAEGLTFTAMIDDVKHTVTYTGSLEVNDLREAEEPENVSFEAAIFECDFEEGSGDAPANFFVVLSDNGLNEDGSVKANSTYYFIDIYAHNYDDMSDGFVTLPVGEYTFDKLNTFAARTFSQMYSYYIQSGATENDVDDQYYDEATLVVTSEGITLTALIDGKTHTVTYTGSLDIAVEVEPEEEAKLFVAEHAMANYMGDFYNPGVADNFTLVLSDLGWDEEGWELPNAAYYVLDLYSEVVEGELAIPYGTYELDLYDSSAPNTIGASYTNYIVLDEYAWDYVEEVYFASGSVTIDANGITAELVDENGLLHKVSFAGTVTRIVDYTEEFGGGGDSDEILSTLWEDWYCNFSDCSMDYTWYGDFYEVGYDNWLLYLMPNGEVGDGLQLDLISNTVGSYELSGEYIISKSQEKFTAYPGYANGSYMEGSWYFNADYSQYAPLVDGDVYITNNGDTTFTIEVDAYDDAGNNIYGSWTGVDPNQAQTFNCQSLVVNNRGMKNKAFSPIAKAMLKR